MRLWLRLGLRRLRLRLRLLLLLLLLSRRLLTEGRLCLL